MASKFTTYWPLLAIPVALVGIAFLVSLVGTSKPALVEEPRRAAEKETGSSAIAPTGGELVATSELISIYSDNEVRADRRWKGHDVEVIGTALSIEKDAFGLPYVMMGTENDRIHVQVSVARKNAAQVERLHPGDTARLRGKVRGLILGNVLVADGELL